MREQPRDENFNRLKDEETECLRSGNSFDKNARSQPGAANKKKSSQRAPFPNDLWVSFPKNWGTHYTQI